MLKIILLLIATSFFVWLINRVIHGIEVTKKNGGRYLYLNIGMSILVGLYSLQFHLLNLKFYLSYLWDWIRGKL
jgi:hypothetical protein